jgi:hypothetical protein
MNQLRYAGRELARILRSIAQTSPAPADLQAIDRAVYDANKHLEIAETDILDTAIAVIWPYVATMRQEYGDPLIGAHVPRFGELVHTIEQTVLLIVASRRDILNGMQHYQQIYRDHFDDLVQIYEALLKAEEAEIIEAHVKREQREAFDRGFQRQLGGIAIIGLAISVLFFAMPALFGEYLWLTVPVVLVIGMVMTRRVFAEVAYPNFMAGTRTLWNWIEGAAIAIAVLVFAVNLPGVGKSLGESLSLFPGALGSLLQRMVCVSCQ